MKTTVRFTIMAIIAFAMTLGNAEGQNVRRERDQREHKENVAKDRDHRDRNENVVRERHHYDRDREVVAVRRWHHRGRRVVVFHPVWGPKLVYHHRWVYFPRYNFYWDNVRGMYVYLNHNAWVVSASVPSFAVRINLNEARKVELPDQSDDIDNIQDHNSQHVSLYKAEQDKQ